MGSLFAVSGLGCPSHMDGGRSITLIEQQSAFSPDLCLSSEVERSCMVCGVVSIVLLFESFTNHQN